MSSSAGPETPFSISIPDEKIASLKQRLELATFPDELEGAEWDYGAPLADVKRLAHYWKDGYDWRKHEAKLNEELPQFTRDIAVDGHGTLNIHYLHKKSKVENAIPLLFVHGWPGSFYEARKLVPYLVESSPEHPSFHVVAISLPGYGFSQAPSKKNFGLDQYAEVSNKLMLSLGYNEYVTQGGDWGYLITRHIAQVYGGQHSKAWHTNFALAVPPGLSRPFLILSHLLSFVPGFAYSAKDQAGIERSTWFSTKGQGYYHEQSSKPQTLGYGLADSPVGLLAWIYEKLVDWTDSYPWEDDDVLTWISIYWFSRAGPTASLRIYYEIAGKKPGAFIEPITSTIPSGMSKFPRDILCFPTSWINHSSLVFLKEHDTGGHFAAHEKPVELAGDLRNMFGKNGPAYGVVTGKDGYP